MVLKADNEEHAAHGEQLLLQDGPHTQSRTKNNLQALDAVVSDTEMAVYDPPTSFIAPEADVYVPMPERRRYPIRFEQERMHAGPAGHGSGTLPDDDNDVLLLSMSKGDIAARKPKPTPRLPSLPLFCQPAKV